VWWRSTPPAQAKNSIAIIHAGPSWPGSGEVAGWSELPNVGKELHTSAGTPAPGGLCHHGTTAITAPAGAPLPDRPRIRSSRTYGLDTKPGPRTPKSGSIGVGRQSQDRHHIKEAQVRRWTSWYRWVTLAILAAAFLTITATAEHTSHPPPDGQVPPR
jgi:hypothetical protein